MCFIFVLYVLFMFLLLWVFCQAAEKICFPDEVVENVQQNMKISTKNRSFQQDCMFFVVVVCHVAIS